MKGKSMTKSRKKIQYNDDLPGRLYSYFLGYDDPTSAPSFTKFARLIGVSSKDIQSFRKHARFEKAYDECLHIRRDYLLDRALCKRFDPSFVKFLLSDDREFPQEKMTPPEDEGLHVKIQVVE